MLKEKLVMKNGTYAALACTLFAALTLASLVSISSAPALAQTGPNAVYNSSGNCNSQSPCAASTAFIDASVFAKSGSDFCTVINAVLKSTVFASSSGVIDARGVPM